MNGLRASSASRPSSSMTSYGGATHVGEVDGLWGVADSGERFEAGHDGGKNRTRWRGSWTWTVSCGAATSRSPARPTRSPGCAPAGERVVFLTNNSSMTRAEYVSKLARHGIEAADDDILTSALAGARVLEPGRPHSCAAAQECGMRSRQRGVERARPTRRSTPSSSAGIGTSRSTRSPQAAGAIARRRAVRRRRTTTRRYPRADGVLPACGPIVAFVATAAGRTRGSRQAQPADGRARARAPRRRPGEQRARR